MDSLLAMFIIGVLLGVCIGLTLSGVLLFVAWKKVMKKLGVEFEQVPATPPPSSVEPPVISREQRPPDVSRRLAQVKALGEAQSDMLAALSMPSTNSLHSKHKNQLTREIKAIEEQKIAILESIVNDGYNPLLTIAEPGADGPKEMKLTDVIAVMRAHQEMAPSMPKKPNLQLLKGFSTVDDFEKDTDDGDKKGTSH